MRTTESARTFWIDEMDTSRVTFRTGQSEVSMPREEWETLDMPVALTVLYEPVSVTR